MKKAISLTLDADLIQAIKDNMPDKSSISNEVEKLIRKGMGADSDTLLTMKQALLQVQEVYKRDILKLKKQLTLDKQK